MLEPMMITSMWESMAAWFTPTLLFFLTNFIIATIFIASNKHHDDHAASTSLTPIDRVSSFIDRARPVNLSSESQHHYPPQPNTANYTSTSRLAQSIYSSPGYVTPPELSEQVERLPSQLAQVEPAKVPDSPGQLTRVPSFLDRVKSFKLSSTFKSGLENIEPDTVNHHVNRSKYEKTADKKSSVEMKKSRSEAPNDDDEEEEESEHESCDKEVDAKADDFISRFKKQLKLQRLESLVRYNEMLNRRR